jgi:quercetin dioxygenase-like cupin family protein
MGWKYTNFKENMNKLGFAYHGGKGKIGYYPIKGLSTIDIDNEEDFQLAEVAMKMRSEFAEPEYYKGITDRVEVDVPDILKKDGVFQSNFSEENEALVNLDELMSKYSSSSSWCHRLVNTENNSATLIAQIPGEGNRLHYHPSWNEWWYILKGKWEWNIEGKKTIVKIGDFVFIEKGRKHKITAIGDEMAIRLAVSRADVEHVYPKES